MDTSSADQARPGLWWQRRPRLPSARWRAVLLAVLVGLLAVEQVWFAMGQSPHSRSHATAARRATLTRQISALVADALGASDRGVRRFRLGGLRADPAHRSLGILTLTWAINGD